MYVFYSVIRSPPQAFLPMIIFVNFRFFLGDGGEVGFSHGVGCQVGKVYRSVGGA